MDTKELFRLALKGISANKLRSFLTTLGIIIGVFSIIVLVSIGSGINSYITKEISSLGPNVIFVIPGSGNPLGAVLSNKLKIQDAENIQRRLKSIAKVTPELRQVETLKYKNSKSTGVIVLGVTSNYSEVISTFKVAEGTSFTSSQDLSGSNVAVIGQTIYQELFDSREALGKKILIGNKQYRVIGIFEKIGSFAGIDANKIALVPVQAASRQYGVDTIGRIDINANSKEHIPVAIKEIDATLSRRLTTDDYSVQTADSVLSTISNITNILSLALGGIAAISLLVGGIGVANIMLVSVTERTREIGLRKAIGARRSDILKQFLLESVMISVFGGIIGIILGMIASVIIAIVLVSTVTVWSIVIAFGFSVFIGVVFGMAPAIRASKLNPIDALRYE